jgi:hypothetical protein
MERCSPRSAPFHPQPRPKVAPLRLAGSSVLQHSPTAPERSRPPYGLWPSRTGLAVQAKMSGSPLGSRACCFSACPGSKTTQDRTSHSRVTRLSCGLLPTGMESASWINGFSKLNSPAHRYLCLRFGSHLTMYPARLEARMDSLLSFPVGLFHPYNMPAYPDALRVRRHPGLIANGYTKGHFDGTASRRWMCERSD